MGVAMSRQPGSPRCGGWPCSARDGGTAAEMGAQGRRRWRRRAPPALRHGIVLGGAELVAVPLSRVLPSSFEGATWRRYESGRHNVME
jgi:hypothetical protein